MVAAVVGLPLANAQLHPLRADVEAQVEQIAVH